MGIFILRDCEWECLCERMRERMEDDIFRKIWLKCRHSVWKPWFSVAIPSPPPPFWKFCNFFFSVRFCLHSLYGSSFSFTSFPFHLSLFSCVSLNFLFSSVWMASMFTNSSLNVHWKVDVFSSFFCKFYFVLFFPHTTLRCLQLHTNKRLFGDDNDATTWNIPANNNEWW